MLPAAISRAAHHVRGGEATEEGVEPRTNWWIAERPRRSRSTDHHVARQVALLREQCPPPPPDDAIMATCTLTMKRLPLPTWSGNDTDGAAAQCSSREDVCPKSREGALAATLVLASAPMRCAGRSCARQFWPALDHHWEPTQVCRRFPLGAMTEKGRFNPYNHAESWNGLS